MERAVYTVTQVNNEIKGMLEGNPAFRNIFVQGEISNLKHHSSGHKYLSLKDSGGVLSAVMFRSDAGRLRFRPENGMKVIARGRISAYPKYGQYQLYIADMMPDGIGALAAAFEQLKQRLYQEGLFDEERKQPIPSLPRTIALVTSPTGAAVRDMLRILRRRFPLARVVIYPTAVQGEQAAPQIAQAIDGCNRDALADVMIVGRGGGSLEDLWAFNEEIVARAIVRSNIPVISAVGHEPDVTIADFAADLRASTPSNAAELCVPDQLELRRLLRGVQMQLASDMQDVLRRKRAQLESVEQRRGMQSPQNYIQDKRFALAQTTDKLEGQMRAQLEGCRQMLVQQVVQLDAFSPLKVLARGYSIVENEDGTVVSSSAKVRKNEKLFIRMAKGGVECTVDRIRRKI